MSADAPRDLHELRRIADAAKALEAKLREGKVPFESHWYKAGHAFLNQNNPSYNAECAKLAWERTAEFFGKSLR